MPLIGWLSAIFLIAPGFLISYVVVYNKRKKRHLEEKEQLRRAFQYELLQSQMEVQEQTLKTIGNDLHDNINQLLGLVAVTLSAVDVTDQDNAAGKIASAESLVRRSIQEIRALSRRMHGEELIGKGLLQAIGFELDWLERSGVYQIIRKGSLEGMPELPEKELIVFRIFQETLQNIIRHAQATVIRVEQSYGDETLLLRLSDNGIGFDLEATRAGDTGMGLSGIFRRAALMGGAVDIVSKPGEGTSVTITLRC
jgi:signal transduction histidine kinase